MDLFAKCHEVPFGRQLQSSGFDAYYRVLQSAPDTEVVVEGRPWNRHPRRPVHHRLLRQRRRRYLAEA